MSLKAIFAAMSIKVKILLACAAVVIVGGITAAVGISMTKEDAYRVLKVFEMSGEATVTREGTGELAAYVGMNLESGDLISVGENSNIRLSLDGNKYILLDELTVLELEAAGTSSDSKTVLKLISGTILNELTQPLSGNSIYEVATPKATMAVRGTSFSVTVTKDSEGRYIITENTYHGQVEVTLLDEKGEKTSKIAIVNPDRSITICTSPNKDTGNPAEIDGTSVFVTFDTETGEMIIIPDGEDPTHDIDYELISAIVKEYAVRSNDTSLMILDETIVNKLRGNTQNTVYPIDTETSVTTTAPQTETSETTVPETTVSEADDEPINSDNTENAAAAIAATMEQTLADTKANETSANTSADTEKITTTAGTAAPEETTTTAVTAAPEETTTTAVTAAPEETTTAEVTTKPETTTTAEVTTKPETTTTAEVTTRPVTVTTFPIITTPVTTTPVITTPVTTTTTPDNEPESFDVTFKCEGEIIKTVTAAFGDNLYDIVSAVTVPEKTGKTGVWKINGVSAVTSNMTVTENITLEAVYSSKTYTVTFFAEGADEPAPEPVKVLYGDSLYDIVSACEVPEKTGHTGVWKINGTTDITADSIVESDITVKAVYTVNKYTVTFNAEGADDESDIPAAAQYDYGTLLSDIVPASVPLKTGHTGVWKINGTTDITADSIVDSNITVKAVYTVNKYTVTFKAEGADDSSTVPAPVEAQYGDSLYDIVSARTIPAKTGYDGIWLLNGTPITETMTVTDDVTITAVYTIQKFMVYFRAPDADDPTTAPSSVEVDYGTNLSTLVTASVPAKTGHTGVWKINGTIDITADSIVDSEIIIKAVYTVNKYTVTFKAEGADNSSTVPAPVEAQYGDSLYDIVSARTIPAKTGYDGIWLLNGTPITETMTVTDDVTITAVYTIQKFMVYFRAPDADDPTTAPSSVEVDYGTNLSTLVTASVPAKTGHTGVWKINGTTDITADSIVDSEIIIKAVYTPIKYTVTFNAEGADDESDIPAAAEYDYGTLLSEIVPAAVPEKTGHTGVWKIGGTTDITADSIVDSDITVKAVYTPIKYTVTFEAEGVDNVDDIPAATQYDYGTLLSDIVPSSVPLKTGHTGVWKINGTTDITADSIVDGNITIKAVYDVNKYTVTFDVSDADDPTAVPDPVEVEYGDDLYKIVSGIAVPKKAGSDGVWLVDRTTEITSPYLIKDNINVYAVYTARTYVNINYNFNGTTGTVHGDSGERLKYDIIPNKIQNETYSNDLMNPYAWLTYNNSWSENGNSNSGKVDSGMTVTPYVIKQDEVEVWSAKKHTITYTIGDTTDKFYLYDNETVGEIYYGFLSDILGDYAGFLLADGTVFTEETTVSADTSITANKYKVTLEYVDGIAAETYYFNEGESFSSRYRGMPAPNAVFGYEATDWKTKTGNTVISANTVINNSMTLIPNQTERSYSVTFAIPDGTPTTVGVPFSASILDYAPSLTESIYNAWFINGIQLGSTTTMVDLINGDAVGSDETEITITARADTSVMYTVTFDASDADAVPTPIEVAYGTYLASAVAGTEVPAKSGSEGFWSIDGTNPIPSDYRIYKDITVTAVYKEYLSVSYTTSGGTTGTLKLNENDSLLTALENLNTELSITNTGIDLDDPYVWVTNNQNWKDVYSGETVRVDSSFTADSYAFNKAQTESPRVYAGSKYQISYTVGTNNGSFYLYDGDKLSDVGQSSYLENLLSGSGYATFIDNNGNEFTATTKASFTISSITPNYKVTLNYANGTTATYYFEDGETFNSRYGSMPSPDAKTGYYALSWKSSSEPVNADTQIKGNLELEPLQMNIDYSLAFYDSDGTTLLNTPSNCIVTYNAVIMDYAPANGVSYWTVNGVAIDSTTTVADVFTGSNYTINIVAVY